MLDIESGHDVAKALLPRYLGIEVDDQLVPSGKMLGIPVGSFAFHFVMELPVGNQVDQLPENCVQNMPWPAPPRIKSILGKSILPKREAGLYISETLLGQ